MSSDKNIIKCDCGVCRRYPTYKVSDCPLEPLTCFTPVYGSLYNLEEVLALPDTNVNFDTKGPSSGVILNTTDNSITVNSQGVYDISFTTIIEVDNLNQPSTINYFFSINGNINLNTLIFSYNNINGVQGNTLSRTHQLTLNPGDVIRVFIKDVSPNIYNLCPGLVVTKVA